MMQLYSPSISVQGKQKLKYAIDNNINPKKYLGKFWLDSLVHDKNTLDYIITLMGEDKIVLGTDYPFPLGELNPGNLIRSMSYNIEKNNKLFSQNALNWLNMSKSDFI